MGTVASRYGRQISSHEQMIYDHFLGLIEYEPPGEMIERFRRLFIDGTPYSVPQVAEALHVVITTKSSRDDFRYILNRCCHILINRWQSNPQHRLEIPKLIHLFETISEGYPLGQRRYRFNSRLIELVKQFRDTEQYRVLCRLAQVLSRAAEESVYGNRPLGTLIRRYPFLYEHCLLSDDDIQGQQNTIRQLQYEVQHQFELDLSKYATHQIRKSLLAENPKSRNQQQLPPVKNPTLLSDGMLNEAIKHYAGCVEGSHSYRDLAHSFITQSGHSQTFASFKDDLYEYIISGITSEYGRRQFNNQLHHHLQLVFPESANKPLNDFLIVRTCSQLFNFLVIDGVKAAQHYTFVDLLTNVGPILTTGLLLRIVLLCRKVLPYLERRFSILFNHYESYNREAVEWLVSALENLNVALTTNFGQLNLTTVK
ncbi:MAG: hypothetical protein AAF327_02590 [Cyanobacteria bacterium P01_A01_bin.37]